MHILTSSDEIGVKVFKNGPSKLSPRQPLKFFKGCLPKILLGPFLNILTYLFWFFENSCFIKTLCVVPVLIYDCEA